MLLNYFLLVTLYHKYKKKKRIILEIFLILLYNEERREVKANIKNLIYGAFLFNLKVQPLFFIKIIFRRSL